MSSHLICPFTTRPRPSRCSPCPRLRPRGLAGRCLHPEECAPSVSAGWWGPESKENTAQRPELRSGRRTATGCDPHRSTEGSSSPVNKAAVGGHTHGALHLSAKLLTRTLGAGGPPTSHTCTPVHTLLHTESDLDLLGATATLILKTKPMTSHRALLHTYLLQGPG